jgi:hypothetical protein
MTFSVKLSLFTIYQPEIILFQFMLIYWQGLLPPNSIGCVVNAAATSQVYASCTEIQRIRENIIMALCCPPVA